MLDEWRETVVEPIHKTNGEIEDSTDYRQATSISNNFRLTL